MSIDVNGVLAGTGTTSSAWNSTGKFGSTFIIGASDRAGTNNYYFNGSIDQVRTYQGTLTPAQVAALYTQRRLVGSALPIRASHPVKDPGRYVIRRPSTRNFPWFYLNG